MLSVTVYQHYASILCVLRTRALVYMCGRQNAFGASKKEAENKIERNNVGINEFVTRSVSFAVIAFLWRSMLCFFTYRCGAILHAVLGNSSAAQKWHLKTQ